MAPPSPSQVSPGRRSPPGKTLSSSRPMAALPPLPLSKDPVALLDSLDQRNRLNTSNNNTKPTPFDPVDFLNKHYETESSLAQQLPALRSSVGHRRQLLNDRISNALQRQSETAVSTRRNVQDAAGSVAELERRIVQIQQKASLSERAVLEITADMKRLDMAKRHLQQTMATLKRLHMLVHAVEQLRLVVVVVVGTTTTTKTPGQQQPFGDYQAASHLVEAVAQLLQHFETYTHKVPPLRVMAGKVTEYQEELRVSLVHGFRVVAFGHAKALALEQGSTGASTTTTTTTTATISKGNTLPKATNKDNDVDDDKEEPNNEESSEPPVMGVSVLQGGVLLIDALGDEVRHRFIHEFCQDHLGDYLHDFAPPRKDATTSKAPAPEKRVSSFMAAATAAEVKPQTPQARPGFAHIEDRFTWFLNGPLKSINAKFPDVFPSHWNLQASLAAMFLQLTRDHILALLDGPRKDPDANNATILLKVLQKTIVFEKDITGWLERECGAVFESPDDATAENGSRKSIKSAAGKEQAVLQPLIGMTSVAYQPYMSPYIRLEEQSMDEQLAEALEDRTVDTRGERPVFISSTNLFVYIKGSITRCTALTKGNAFFQLYGAFRGSLKKYAQMLNKKLPAQIPAQGAGVVGGIVIAPFGGKQESPGTSASYRIPVGEEVTVCHVISTCEYCADTMEALEDLIRDTIDPKYQNKIDMMSDQEQFHDITAKSIRVLVSGLTNRMEGALKNMATTNWGTWDAVGEESSYVLSIHEETEPFVKTVRNLLPTSYFRSFCDKFALAFTMTYYENMVRLKRISEPGTQQLLLDLYNLKTLFLKIPVLEDAPPSGKKAVSKGASIAPAMYTKMVQKQFGRMETILKLVGTPLDMLIDNFKMQWPGGTTSDLTVVMTLKGMKRTEQAAMLEKFGYDPVSARKGATANVTSAAIVSERVQQLQDQGSTVAAKVNSDLNNMRQKVDDFRRTFR